MSMRFDYVIVGAGSAGATLAARLSERRDVSVLLLEAGGQNGGLLERIPAAVAARLSYRNARNWAFETVPQTGLNGRRGYQPRGRGLGGSSAINAMIYLRGQPQDYDDWAAAGCRGWGWREVLPYFRRAEHNERGADEWHGTGGPLNVADPRSPNPFSCLFIEAARQAGIAPNPDFNGPTQEGCGLYQVTQKNGERWSTARAYLDPVRQRPNLTICTDAPARHVVFADRRAVGVAFDRGGSTAVARAEREVILCAGSLQSPQLLMLSGIGRAANLRELGLPVLHDAPGVGANLHDHPDIIINRRVDSADLLGLSPAGAWRLLRAVRDWRHGRRGLLTSNFAEAGAIVRSRPAAQRPDLQLLFVVGLVDDHLRRLHWGHGMSCHASLLRPASRGTVRLAAADSRAAPLIDPAFLAAADDLEGLLRGVRLIRRIFAQPAFAPFDGGNPARELHFAAAHSDDEIRAAIRAHADTTYHPVGTCRMGGDAGAVLDPQLRVRGVQGLRVVDASIMPTIVSGNPNAAVVMIAERAADLIRAS